MTVYSLLFHYHHTSTETYFAGTYRSERLALMAIQARALSHRDPRHGDKYRIAVDGDEYSTALADVPCGATARAYIACDCADDDGHASCLGFTVYACKMP